MLEYLIKSILAYGLGGIMGGDVMRWLGGGADLRSAGSGNVGATNALRTRGAKFALGVLLIDIGKGIAAVLLIPRLPWLGATEASTQALLPYFCGYGVALGHCYPLFQRFRGGKGVATLTGVFAALLPALLPWLLITFLLMVMLTGYVSLASITGSIVAVLAVGLFGAGFASAAGIFTSAMLALVLFKHRQNLARLWAGTESRFEKARWLGRQIEKRWR
ncbi:MAG: glycerol-3-phosphate 1-O-acyltransferase PlsY [Nevskia sp.]|jgi:glycerol-3-phosphate acyltransferase PlsY|nr:glycerol-3-phosphate 1-O-acyltransferase PlsY [Nevskia sp.]MCK9384061.1 glycerol-3-phosphate 1-O-acyltransferase PlsY [Nevskia sp.]